MFYKFPIIVLITTITPDFPFEIDKNYLSTYCKSTYSDFLGNLMGENAKSVVRPIILHQDSKFIATSYLYLNNPGLL